MADKKYTNEPRECFHCNSKGIMEIIGNEPPRQYRYGDQDDPTQDETIWLILKCPVCSKETVVRRFWYSEWDEYEEDEHGQIVGIYHNFEEEVIYPKNVPLKNEFRYLPLSVKRTYEVALRVYSIDLTAFAVFIGKTIECLANDKGAKGNYFWQKIDDLVAKGIIPGTYKTIANLLKDYRNDSAHDCEIPKISQEEADKLLYLCKKILDYVYETPSISNETEQLRNAKKRKS